MTVQPEDDVQEGWLGLLAGRRSVRRYGDRPVPPALIARLLEAATWAPSAHNRQPWRFCVLDERPWRARLAEAMGARLRADRTADGDPPDAIERDVARSRARITEAPAVVVLSLSMGDMDGYRDERRQRAEYLMAVQSTAMAAQNLLLAAEALGLGACWMCAPLFCPDVVARALGLPEDWQPQALVTLGWPAQAGRRRERRPLSQIVRRPTRQSPAKAAAD